MKVRGVKIAEWYYGGSKFAVVKMADEGEGEFISLALTKPTPCCVSRRSPTS